MPYREAAQNVQYAATLPASPTAAPGPGGSTAVTCHESTQHIDTRHINVYTRSVSMSGERPRADASWPDDEFILISVAARHLGMHPQTLRKYERLGLVRPSRTLGSMRVYSRDELARLRTIKHLVDEAGVNLAGVQRLLEVADVLQRIRPMATGGEVSRASVRRLAQELDRLSAMLGL